MISQLITKMEDGDKLSFAEKRGFHKLMVFDEPEYKLPQTTIIDTERGEDVTS